MVDVYFKLKILGKDLVRVDILEIIRAGRMRGRAPSRRRFYPRGWAFYAFFCARGGVRGWGTRHHCELSLRRWLGVWREPSLK